MRIEKPLLYIPSRGDVYTHIRSGTNYVVTRVVLDNEEVVPGFLWKSVDPLVVYRSLEDDDVELGEAGGPYGRPLTEFASRFVAHREKNV